MPIEDKLSDSLKRLSLDPQAGQPNGYMQPVSGTTAMLLLASFMYYFRYGSGETPYRYYLDGPVNLCMSFLSITHMTHSADLSHAQFT